MGCIVVFIPVLVVMNKVFTVHIQLHRFDYFYTWYAAIIRCHSNLSTSLYIYDRYQRQPLQLPAGVLIPCIRNVRFLNSWYTCVHCTTVRS